MPSTKMIAMICTDIKNNNFQRVHLDHMITDLRMVKFRMQAFGQSGDSAGKNYDTQGIVGDMRGKLKKESFTNGNVRVLVAVLDSECDR